jgi:hypothetical protein|eukprot:5471397-Prymnesium_polylepis.3
MSTALNAATLHCVPNIPPLGLLHIPLLEHAQLAGATPSPSEAHPQEPWVDVFNQTEGDAFVAKSCGHHRLTNFCDAWDGISLCVMQGRGIRRALHGPVAPASLHFRRQLRVFTLFAACNSAVELKSSAEHSAPTSSKLHGVCAVSSEHAGRAEGGAERAKLFSLAPCGC